MGSPIYFRWLGAAGIELTASGRTLIIDPYFSRIPFWNVFIGRLRSRPDLVETHIVTCHEILVTHSHFDHLMDVPLIARRTGARVYGSLFTCRLLSRCGVPDEQIFEIQTGDRLDLNGFKVRVLKSWHTNIPWLNGGDVPVEKSPPGRARDFRMDKKFAFEIDAHGVQLLTDPGRELEASAAADILFLRPDLNARECRALLKSIRPRLVIPIHWESHHRPLNKPLRPAWRPPGWRFPPVQRFDLNTLKEMIQGSGAAAKLFVPEVLHLYAFREVMDSFFSVKPLCSPLGAGASCASNVNPIPNRR